MPSWKTLEEFEKDLLRDDGYRREFENLEPEYQIARTILSARRAIGMSQQALAKSIGTSQSRVSLWERAEEVPRWATLKKIANATGIPFHIGIEPSNPSRRAKKSVKTRVAKRGGETKGKATLVARKTVVKSTARRAARKTAAKKASGRRRS